MLSETRRHHSEEAQNLLTKAGMSRESELTLDQAATLDRLVLKKSDMPRDRLYRVIMGREQQGENRMATKTKKSAPSKATVNKIASMRRDGATWQEVIDETGVKTNSTGFRELLEANGFDKLGVKKGSNQKSKAKGWGSAANGTAPAPKPAAKAKPKAKRIKRKK